MKDNAQQLREKSLATRKKYLDMLYSGKIDFEQFLSLAQGEDMGALRNIQAIEILSNAPGWSRPSARRAFMSHGMSERLRVQGCMKGRGRTILPTLLRTSSKKWEERVKAPVGWPWYGNLMDTLRELKEDERLPVEAQRAVRFEFPDEETKKEQQAFDSGAKDEVDDLDFLTDDLDDEPESPIDGLDLLFDGEDEDEDDDFDYTAE